MKCCFFIGHRDARDSVLPKLSAAIERHINEYGVEEFVVGHYGGFDRIVTTALLSAKKVHPSIRLYLLIPYHPSVRPIKIPAGFDGTLYPPDMETIPPRYAIVRANRYAVDRSNYLIAYVQHSPSNAADLVAYAHTKKHCIVTILEHALPPISTGNS